MTKTFNTQHGHNKTGTNSSFIFFFFLPTCGTELNLQKKSYFHFSRTVKSSPEVPCDTRHYSISTETLSQCGRVMYRLAPPPF